MKYSLQAGEARKAEIALRDEKKLHSERLDTYILLARLYLQTKENEKAAQTLDELFIQDPNHTEGLKLKGTLFIKDENYEEALDTLAKILPQQEDLKTFLYQAECLQRLKQMKDSEKVLQKALKIEPTNATTLFMLGNAYKATKQFTKAYLMYRLAKKYGVEVKKCQKKMQACWKFVSQRRQKKSKKSA